MMITDNLDIRKGNRLIISKLILAVLFIIEDIAHISLILRDISYGRAIDFFHT